MIKYNDISFETISGKTEITLTDWIVFEKNNDLSVIQKGNSLVIKEGTRFSVECENGDCIDYTVKNVDSDVSTPMMFCMDAQNVGSYINLYSNIKYVYVIENESKLPDSKVNKFKSVLRSIKPPNAMECEELVKKDNLEIKKDSNDNAKPALHNFIDKRIISLQLNRIVRELNHAVNKSTEEVSDIITLCCLDINNIINEFKQ